MESPLPYWNYRFCSKPRSLFLILSLFLELRFFLLPFSQVNCLLSRWLIEDTGSLLPLNLFDSPFVQPQDLTSACSVPDLRAEN